MVVLPTPRGPVKQERVRDAAGRDRGLQGARDVLLADDVGEALRPEPPGQDLVGHRRPAAARASRAGASDGDG